MADMVFIDGGPDGATAIGIYFGILSDGIKKMLDPDFFSRSAAIH